MRAPTSEVIPLPEQFTLLQNYPNPFNPTTNLAFELPESGFVLVKIFDVTGREIAVLANGFYDAGKHVLTFNAQSLPGGTYFARIQSASNSGVIKLTLLK